FLYDTKSTQLHQATSGYLNDGQPVFDPEGKYLFYASDRTFDPVYGAFDNSWTYANPTQIVAVPLRKDVKSPLAALNDSENEALNTNKHEKKPENESAGDKTGGDKTAGEKARTHPDAADKTAKDKAEKKTPPAPPAVDIDLAGFESRGVVLPPKAGR